MNCEMIHGHSFFSNCDSDEGIVATGKDFYTPL